MKIGMDMMQSEASHESGGFVKGVAIAIVTQNKDDETGLCRVKVRYPWHERSNVSHWARLALPMTGSERGMLIIPEVGDEVLVAFEREDMRFPYVIGGLWNGESKPPIAKSDRQNDKRVWRSRKKHQLLFDDGARGAVELTHEKGRKIVLDDDGFVVTDENGNRITVNSKSNEMTLETKGKLNLKASSVSIVSTSTLELKATATVTIRGALVNIN
jgi:uncharacterized protein involved in type VI secretion and phage assembly